MTGTQAFLTCSSHEAVKRTYIFFSRLFISLFRIFLLGTFGIEATLTGYELRLGSCLAVENSNENSKLILKGCNDTDTKQQWSFTLKGGLIVSMLVTIDGK